MGKRNIGARPYCYGCGWRTVRAVRDDSAKTVLVSIDGVAPRFITPERMPTLTGLARDGAGCFTARTVTPPLTRPVHASMLRGVEPEVHGIVDNSPSPIDAHAPSIFAVASRAGLSTASFTSWAPLDSLIEPDAAGYRVSLDSGYEPTDDELLIDQVTSLLQRRSPDLMFVYISAPDLAGHSEGWGSKHYLRSLEEADAALARLLAASNPFDSILVTTDHGGAEQDHSEVVDDVMDTWLVVRSPRIKPGAMWDTASVSDVAPTLADLCNLEPDPAWTGRSLLGAERPLIDVVMETLAETDAHSYGEGLSMLEHALQTAHVLRSRGADDDLTIAGLLHDVGHLRGEAGTYGYADHAVAADRWLGPWFPQSIVGPIRLHVDAKRHLVGSDPQYRGELSEASVITLDQQGGPFDAAESERFLADPQAPRAIELRKCDDAGKLPGEVVPRLGEYRDLLERVLVEGATDPVEARDACSCPECRDVVSGQHLLSQSDLGGFEVLGRSFGSGELLVDLVRDGSHHRAIVVESTAEVVEAASSTPAVGGLRAPDDVHGIASDVIHHGFSHVAGLGSAEGEVLRFAATLGFVRETNYGQLFDVRTIPSPNNLAYSPVGLPLHTDNPYRDPTPSVQVLHCLKPAHAGGATRLSDGVAAGEWLRENHPDDFELLCSTPVDFRFRDDEVDLRATRSVISLRANGSIGQVAFNNRSLVTPQTTRFATALGRFSDRLDFEAIELTLKSGEAIVFDNRRVLHARTGFDPSSGRHLQGCYIDIDAIASLHVRSSPMSGSPARTT